VTVEGPLACHEFTPIYTRTHAQYTSTHQYQGDPLFGNVIPEGDG